MKNTEQNIPVIVMCGGFATRMGGEPKYLLPVDDKTQVIDLALQPIIGRKQKVAVVNHVIFASGKHRDEVVDYKEHLARQNLGVDFDVSYSPPRGQFDAILNAVNEYDIRGSLAVVFGDEVLPGLDLEDVWFHHKKGGKMVTRVVTRQCNEGSTVVFVNDNNLIIQEEKTSDSQPYYATGVMVLSPQALCLAREIVDQRKFVRQVINGEQMKAYIHERSFNVNTPTDLNLLRKKAKLGV